MKIIHCADLHIDSKLRTNFSKEQAKIRREELLRTYERMISFAVEKQVDAIILAGDLFDKSNVGKRARTRVMEQIVLNPQIDFLYLRGNHDGVDILEGIETKPDNLKMFGEKDWISYQYGDVVISGIEINKDNYKSIYGKLILDKSQLNIVVLHGQTSDYGSDVADNINLSLLKNHYIDYLALGHIHQYKKGKLDDRGMWCYSGCLEGRGFDECGEKGFVLLDIENGKITDEFIPFATRNFHEIKVDISGIDGMFMTNDILERMREESEHIPQKDLVKFILTGNVDLEDEVDFTRIKMEFEEKFYFTKVYDCTLAKPDYSVYAGDKSLKGEFVRLLQEEDIEEKTKNKILEIGLKALRGEEIEWL